MKLTAIATFYCLFEEDNGSTLIEVEFNVNSPIMMIFNGVLVYYDINSANHGVVFSPAFNAKLATNSTCLDVPTHTKKGTPYDAILCHHDQNTIESLSGLAHFIFSISGHLLNCQSLIRSLQGHV